jgi:hypothetical protein
MTNSLVVDGVALRAIIGRVAAVADEVTGQYANQFTAMSAPVATALSGSAIGRVGTSPRMVGDLQQLGTAIYDWIQNVRRSEADLASAEEATTYRLG